METQDVESDMSTDVIVLNDTTCSSICVEDLSEGELDPTRISYTPTKDDVCLKGSTMLNSGFATPEKNGEDSKDAVTWGSPPRTPKMSSASWTKSCAVDIVSATPETLESSTTSSPILQREDSSDSFVVPTAIRKVLQDSPCQTQDVASDMSTDVIVLNDTTCSSVCLQDLSKVELDHTSELDPILCEGRSGSILEIRPSPTSESGDSSDSFVVSTAIRKFLEGSSKRTPRKKGRGAFKKTISSTLKPDKFIPPVDPPFTLEALGSYPKSSTLGKPTRNSQSKGKFCASLELGDEENSLVDPVATRTTSLISPEPTTLKRLGGCSPTKLSPTLESSNSSDSLVVPAAIRKALPASPKQPSSERLKLSSSETRDQKTDPLNTSGPSPYKSQRPSYLPKNAKLAKRRRKERDRFLQEVEMLDAQFVQLPAILTSAQSDFHTYQPYKTFCLLGTQTPLISAFKPQNVFANYNEASFETKFGTNPITLLDKFKFFPYDVNDAECQMMVSLLTVTSQWSLPVSLSWVIREHIKSGKYELKWVDLKEMLINLGLTSRPLKVPNGYYCIDTSKPVPKEWNFKLLLAVVELSFASWTTKKLVRLLSFLVDCLFEPLLQPLLFEVASLMIAVAKFLLEKDVALDQLMPAVNRSHLSMICNRVIIQHLSAEPALRPLSTSLAYRTICGLLDVKVFESVETLADVTNLLADVSAVRSKTEVDDVYQLILICENLVAISSFDDQTKTFLSKLADFAERISFTYSHFEQVHFSETVARVKSLCGIDHL